MKIYKITAKIYHYWMNSMDSGYVSETHYFVNENNAKRFMAEIENAPYWINFDREKELLAENDKYKMPHLKMEIVETED